MTTTTQPPTTRKTRKPQTRHVAIGATTNGSFAVHMTIGTGDSAKHYGYYVQPIPADFGLGFHFEKFGTEQEDGEPSDYYVLIDPQHGFHTCECKGFSRWGHCKHLEAVLALIKSGKLAVPAPKPQPAAVPVELDDL